MEWDPHTLHVIIQRIRNQMRCPQCGEKVPVELASVRMTGEDYLLLQLKCDVCDAYIVLHASMHGLKFQTQETHVDHGMNISTALCSKDLDVDAIRELLGKADGSFAALFETQNDKNTRK